MTADQSSVGRGRSGTNVSPDPCVATQPNVHPFPCIHYPLPVGSAPGNLSHCLLTRPGSPPLPSPAAPCHLRGHTRYPRVAAKSALRYVDRHPTAPVTARASSSLRSGTSRARCYVVGNVQRLSCNNAFPILAATPLATSRFPPRPVSPPFRGRGGSPRPYGPPQAALPLHCVHSYAWRDSPPPSLRCCHSISAPPSGVSRCSTSFPSPPPLLPCRVSPFHSENDNTATTAPICSTPQIVRIDSLSPPAEPSIPTSLRSICQGFVPDPAQLARSAAHHRLRRRRTTPALRPGRIAPKWNSTSGPRIRMKSFVSLRTEPGFCGPHQSGSPLHGQNRSSLRSSQYCPFRPL